MFGAQTTQKGEKKMEKIEVKYLSVKIIIPNVPPIGSIFTFLEPPRFTDDFGGILSTNLFSTTKLQPNSVITIARALIFISEKSA